MDNKIVEQNYQKFLNLWGHLENSKNSEWNQLLLSSMYLTKVMAIIDFFKSFWELFFLGYLENNAQNNSFFSRVFENYISGKF
jgi:hypothetical protein